MKKRRPILLIFLTALTILIQAVGLDAFAATGDQYIATGNVNLRSGPSTKYSKIDYILKNKEVEFISQYNSTWNKVKYNGKIGYASSKYLKPASTEAASPQEYVTTAGVHFRTGPSTSYASLGIVSKGSTVQLISISNNWASVIYNGRTGYMHAAYISPKTENTPPPDSTSVQEYVTTAGVNFRSGPSTSYASLGIVSKGTTVQLISISNNWANVIYKGKTGYMHAAYISPKAENTPLPDSSSTQEYVTTAGVNFRTGPSTRYASLGIVSKGTTVQLISISKNWANVIYKGKTGYISLSYLKKKEILVEKPKIGLAWTPIRDLSYSRSAEAVIKAGGIVVHLPQVENEAQAKDALSKVDGVIFTGGGDIDPKYYNESLIKDLLPRDVERINSARDISELALMKAAFVLDKATLGICRGSQVMNVAAGGSLYQDIPTQIETSVTHRDPQLVKFVNHDIVFVKNTKLASMYSTSTLNANSWHHQAVKDLGNALIVSARSTDGIIEGIEMPSKRFMVGVQFHPEYNVYKGDIKHLKIFQELINASK